MAALSGGNSRATMRSLNACPYRATLDYPRPLIAQSYPGDNCSDTGGLPGGMLIGRLVGVDAAGFVGAFGQLNNREMRLALPSGWSWSMSLRGAAGAAEGVTSCMAETSAQGGAR
jgi:hypothetical protein